MKFYAARPPFRDAIFSSFTLFMSIVFFLLAMPVDLKPNTDSFLLGQMFGIASLEFASLLSLLRLYFCDYIAYSLLQDLVLSSDVLVKEILADPVRLSSLIEAKAGTILSHSAFFTLESDTGQILGYQEFISYIQGILEDMYSRPERFVQNRIAIDSRFNEFFDSSTSTPSLDEWFKVRTALVKRELFAVFGGASIVSIMAILLWLSGGGGRLKMFLQI